jgi:hypothetical protein
VRAVACTVHAREQRTRHVAPVAVTPATALIPSI